MANPEHLAKLREGVEAWNAWRAANRNIRFDLSGIDSKEYYKRMELGYRRMELVGFDFSGVGSLSRSEFELTTESVVSALLAMETWQNPFEWDNGGTHSYADIRSAHLQYADLTKCMLIGADLRRTDLTGADLSEVKGRWALLKDSNLSETIFRNADLSLADFRGSELSYANFSGADLRGARFDNAHVIETTFDGAKLDWAIFSSTTLAGLDLSEADGLSASTHFGVSYLDIHTFVRSGGRISHNFLKGCGIPDSFILYSESLVGAAIEFYSCFLSYSTKDQDFADRLYGNLQAKGVRCWFAPVDLKIGDRFRIRIDESIRLHDKLLLILSERSIASPWVEDEVESALERERRDGKPVLFPVTLDDAVWDTKVAWAASMRRMRHIGDFRKWKDHQAYLKAFERLLGDLKPAAAR